MWAGWGFTSSSGANNILKGKLSQGITTQWMNKGEHYFFLCSGMLPCLCVDCEIPQRHSCDYSYISFSFVIVSNIFCWSLYSFWLSPCCRAQAAKYGENLCSTHNDSLHLSLFKPTGKRPGMTMEWVNKCIKISKKVHSEGMNIFPHRYIFSMESFVKFVLLSTQNKLTNWSVMWQISHSSSHDSAHNPDRRSEPFPTPPWWVFHVFLRVQRRRAMHLPPDRSLANSWIFTQLKYLHFLLPSSTWQMNPNPVMWSALTQKPKAYILTFPFFSFIHESKQGFQGSFLIDVYKILPSNTAPKTPLCTKGFLFCNNTKVISQFLFVPHPPNSLPTFLGGTSNPEQIKMTFEPFLLYFFSWADFFSEAVIRGLNPTAASRLLTNRCWAAFVPMTLISPACQALQNEV